ncbi:Toxic cation resistance protein, partial [Streptomyces sp. E11-3]
MGILDLLRNAFGRSRKGRDEAGAAGAVPEARQEAEPSASTSASASTSGSTSASAVTSDSAAAESVSVPGPAKESRGDA